MTEVNADHRPDLLSLIGEDIRNKGVEHVDLAIRMARAALTAGGIVVPTLEEVTSLVIQTPTLAIKHNPQEEMLTFFGCDADQIAHRAVEINGNTKAYVGPLVNYDNQGQIVRIFDLLPRGIEHVYTVYPEGRIIFQDVTIGDKKPKELEAKLDERDIKVSENGRYLLKSKEFAESIPGKRETIRTARTKVGYLELPGNPTTDQIYGRIKALGEELCQAAVGPHLRLKDVDQPLGEWYWIAMKQITVRDGSPGVFGLERNEDGIWLDAFWADPGYGWGPDGEVVFSLRKDTPKP